MLGLILINHFSTKQYLPHISVIIGLNHILITVIQPLHLPVHLLAPLLYHLAFPFLVFSPPQQHSLLRVVTQSSRLFGEAPVTVHEQRCLDWHARGTQGYYLRFF